MKFEVLLSLGLCLNVFLMGCKDDDPVNLVGLQVSIHSSSQTLVEGGDIVEVTVELDRKYNEIKYLYLDYGASNGEYANFFESALRNDAMQVDVEDEKRWVLRIPFLAGQQKKVIRLQAEEDDMYRGNRPLELRVLAYEQEKVQYKAEMTLNYEEKTPKPIFGIIFANRETDTTATRAKRNIEHLIIPITSTGRFQFPQTIQLSFSGTAEEGTHYEKTETITVEPSYDATYRTHFRTSNYGVLKVLRSGNFSTPKTIRVRLSGAEEAEISRGREFTNHIGEKFILQDTYTLTITE